jgi:hypothetical protein
MAVIYVRDKDALPSRRLFDFYPTDALTTASGVHLARSQLTREPRQIVDPGAGTGVWGIESRKQWPDACIVGIDIREVPRPDAYDLWYCGDFLADDDRLSDVDLVIGNPPYIHAEQFCRRGLDLLAPGGILLYLLRLTFLESKRRLKLFREALPCHIAVLSRRPSFMGDGSRKTSPDAYAFFVWKKGSIGETAMSWINTDEQKVLDSPQNLTLEFDP